VRFICDDAGAGILEYSLVLSLVAMLCIAALLLLGGSSTSSLVRSSNGFPSSGPSVGQ